MTHERPDVLVVCTTNPHKTDELAGMLAPVRVVAADPDMPDVVEDGATFVDNARLKARAGAQHHPGSWVLADDSGLEVDALGGRPGVHSARFAGADASDADNVRHLLALLDGHADMSARFRCVLVLIAPDGREWTADGSIEGHVVDGPRGGAGFGYDPVFIPEGHAGTLAELGPSVKDELSHRARAVSALRGLLDW